MPCLEGTDPADFDSGVVDPIDDPDPLLPEITIDDVTAHQDPDGTWWCKFSINVTNINYDDAAQFDYATASGTAIQGGPAPFYVAKSGIYTIPAGETDAGTIDVQINLPYHGVPAGTYYFYLNLSNPSNCTLDDTQGRGAIVVTSTGGGDDGGGGDGDGDPIDEVSYTGFQKQSCNSANDGCTIYDQFSQCAYKSACTAFGAAAAMSALYWRKTGNFQRFDAWKLWRDAPVPGPCDCHSCPGTSPPKTLKYARDTGIKMIDSATFKKFGSFSEFSDNTTAGLVKKIKQALVDNGVVCMMSKFYSSPQHGWNRCLDCNQSVLRNPDKGGPWGASTSGCLPPPASDPWTNSDLTDSGVGHFWIITGWNDNKAGSGAFEIQSSHGNDWGLGGRCWMPYSFLKTTSAWGYWKVTYGG